MCGCVCRWCGTQVSERSECTTGAMPKKKHDAPRRRSLGRRRALLRLLLLSIPAAIIPSGLSGELDRAAVMVGGMAPAATAPSSERLLPPAATAEVEEEPETKTSLAEEEEPVPGMGVGDHVKRASLWPELKREPPSHQQRSKCPYAPEEEEECGRFLPPAPRLGT